MFPIRDENPTLHASVATFLIVAINAVVWVLVQHLGMQPGLTESVWRYGVIPGEVLGRIAPGTRVPAGADMVAVLDGVPNLWSILTSMFMHGGWMHLIGNMWFLWIFGDNVEDAMGPVRFALFYLVCGLAAAAAQIATNPAAAVPMVGASGAIGGVMGAYARLYPQARVQTLIFLGFYVTTTAIPAYGMLGYWFVLQVLGGLPRLQGEGGGVAFWAHIGGFLAGLILIRPMYREDYLQQHFLAGRRER